MSIFINTFPVPAEVFGSEIERLMPGVTIWKDVNEAQADKVEAILAWALTAELAGRFPNAKLVCSMAAGVEKILPAMAALPGVPLARIVDPMQALAMSQFVVMMALRHVRRLPVFEAQQAERQWVRIAPPHPFSHTVAVLGLGATGTTVCEQLRHIGFNVIGWSRSPKRIDGVQSYTGASGLKDCLSRADLIVCVLPSTPQTKGVLNHETLSAAKPGAYLVNVGRGDHLVEPDFIALVKSGHLSGAALDVQSREPLPADDPLWTVPQVTITPHIAAAPSPRTVAEQFLEALGHAKQGIRPRYAVDQEAGY
jgi:D-3-phosphoglycerate dehydrogenase/glyoxylate/hydroxypyruvate reductase A